MDLMKYCRKTRPYSTMFLTIAGLSLATTLALMPFFFGVEAKIQSGDGFIPVTHSHDDGLPNYDIRLDKSAYQTLAELRTRSGKSAPAVADVRDRLVEAEARLVSRMPHVKVEYGRELRQPEVIAPAAPLGREFLASANAGNRPDALKRFLRDNNELFGLGYDQIDNLKVSADYTNPEGKLSFVTLTQEIGGIPVFQGEVRAGFTPDGNIIRIINNLAPGIDTGALASDFGDPASAVAAAAQNIGRKLAPAEQARNSAISNDSRVVFGTGDWAITADKLYFPTEPGVVRPAWGVIIWEPKNAYFIITDAANGTILWRKNITEDQTQSATYNIWANPNAMINVAESPFPFTPGPTSPNGQQPPALARTSLSIIGNEGVYAFNNNGWIPDGGTTTDGNAVEAGLDRDSNNGVDTTNGKPDGTASRLFDYPISPGVPTNPQTNQGENPLPASGLGSAPTPCIAPGTNQPMTNFQKAAVTQLFYITNRYHDEMYRLGFTEAARNFQDNNFGRGGLGGDRVSAEAQDCSGVNNANFSTPPDGTRGRMQMYLWTAPNPDFDGDLDADIVVHELTHGLSNRLHGNGSGLTTNMSRGMGEGWSDFYAHAMLSEPSDPINGIYTTGGYATYLMSGVGFNNYYYGIRRFPKAVMSFTGGPNNRPHNPLTFADIDATQMNLSDGAFPPAFTGTADQVHNMGEVWSSALWEVRARYINRLGWAIGNRRILQHVTDGMKLAPLNPTFLQERDAIVAAAQAGGDANDVADVWAGFAIRGMGFSAVVNNPGSGGGTTRVTEAFDLPNLTQTAAITVSDASGNNNGFPEPGEPITINLPLTNNTGNAANNTTVQLIGGGSANYGTIANGTTETRGLSFTIPPSTPCGSTLNLTFNVNSSLGPISLTRAISVGVPITSLSENFDSVSAPGFPAGWTVTTESGGTAFVNSTANPFSPPNAPFALDPLTVGGGTSLVSPSVAIASPAATVSFRHSYDTEAGWDGGVLEISVNGGSFQDILAAGGSFVTNGYNSSLGAGTNNPLANRNAWTGNSFGYLTTTARLPASAAGQNVQFRWRFGADDNTAATGWFIDDVGVIGNYQCGFSSGSGRVRADFDGDGKSDISVFRPSAGIWYISGSQTGFQAYGWGINGDRIVPGDYDGDGKTDAAVWRTVPGSNSVFYVLKSNGFVFTALPWGVEGDIPVVGDYDGDGVSDYAVYRPSNNVWYVIKSTGGTAIFSYGLPGDIPVVGDFDGDGRVDPTVYRSGTWITQRSTGGAAFVNWGLPTDKLVPADYDGDGKDDYAIYRPSDGVWWVIRSSDGNVEINQWGISTDIPAVGDFDGDGKADRTVYRDGVWYILKSSGGVGFGFFGLAGDKPVETGYLPQ